MEKKVFSVELCRTGTPWRFDNGVSGMLRGLSREIALEEAYKREPLEPPFTPFVAKCSLRHFREDGSKDIKLVTCMRLSNGSGPTRPLMFYNLAKDGSVRHFGEYDKWGEPFNPQCWFKNVPTWKPLYFEETRQAALCFLMCWKRQRRSTFRHVVRDIAVMIAKMVYTSHRELVWESCSSSIRPETKRRRKK